MKMKAVVIYEAGGPEQLRIETREIPKLKEGWTLVKIKGFGINRSEIFTREGYSPSVKFPFVTHLFFTLDWNFNFATAPLRF